MNAINAMQANDPLNLPSAPFRGVKNVVKMFFRDKWFWMAIPLLILLSSFVVNIAISAFVGSEGTPIYTGGVCSIFIYLFIVGTLAPMHTFPFALGLGIRRKDYFAGTVIMGMIVGAGASALLSTLSDIESWTGWWGVYLHFFNLPAWGSMSWFGRLGAFFGVFVFLFLSGFTISGIHRRFGRTGMIFFFPAMALAMGIASVLITYYEGWAVIFDWFADQSVGGLVLWLTPISAVFLVASYAMIRRATVS